MLAIIALLLICSPFIWWYLVLQKYKSLNAIQGPKPYPVVGNAYAVGNTPQKLLKNCMKFSKQYGGLFKVYIANELKVFIARPELLEQIMSSNVHITKSVGYNLLKPWLNTGLLISTGPKWKLRRRMITPTFHFQILDQFLEAFNSNSDILAEKLSKEVGKSIDVYPLINLFALDVICEAAMGLKISTQEGKNTDYVHSIRHLLDIFIIRFFSAWKKFDWLFKFSSEHDTYTKCINTVKKLPGKVIVQRKIEKSQQKIQTKVSDDGIKRKVALLDMLLESADNNLLSNEDLNDEINTFMFEGHDTTTSGISFALLALTEDLEIQERLYREIEEVVGSEKYITIKHLQDMKYLEMVIKEVQRKYPPVPFIERGLESNFTIGDIEFPKDTTLTLYIYGVHHNEKYFPNPENFDPDRFLKENQANRHNYAFVPFSAGARNCIGQKFAMIDMKVAVIKVLQKYRIFPVPGYKPDLGMAGSLKSYNGVQVRFEKRH